MAFSEKKSIESILDSISDSGCFGKSKRQYALLEYLLRENDAGRLDKIKEYSIAVNVYDRPKDFDPKTDSIVRAEMARLRKNILVYNSQAKNFTLSLKSRSYKIDVVKKAKPSPNPIRLKNLKRFIILGVSAVLAALIFSLGSLAFYTDKPIEETFRMTVSLDIDPQDNGAEEVAVLNQLKNKLLIFLPSSPFTVVTDAAHSDYNVMLSINNNFLEVISFDRSGQVVFSRNYALDDRPAASLVSSTAYDIMEDGFSDVGALSRYHGNNKLVAKARRDLFGCYYQSLTYTLVAAPKFYKGDLLDCLDPSQTHLKSDQALIALQRADVYTKAYINSFQKTKKQDLLFKAEAELKSAALTLSHKTRHFYILNLRLVQLKYPNDLAQVRLALEQFISAYPNDPTSDFVAAYTFGLYLGDWEAAINFARLDSSDGSRSDIRLHVIPAFYYIFHEEYDLARRYTVRRYGEKSITTTAWQIAFDCILNPEQNFHDLRQVAKKFNLATKEAYIAFITSRNYHKSNEAIFMQDAVIKHCPVF